MKTSLKFALVGAALAIALGSVGFYVMRSHTFDVATLAAQAEPAAEAYRKAGLPWLDTDLSVREPLASESGNAAPLVESAIAVFDAASFRAARTKIATLRAQGHYGQIGTFLDPFSRSLDLAKEAAAKPGLDFHRDWAMGRALSFSEHRYLKEFVAGLCWRAESEAANGKAESCVQDLDAALRLADLAGSEPVAIALLVQIAGEMTAMHTVQACAYIFRDNPAALSELARLPIGDNGPDLGFYLRGEAYFGLTGYRNLDLMGANDGDANPPLDPNRLRRDGLPSDRNQRAALTCHLLFWTEFANRTAGFHGSPDALDREFGEVAAEWRAKLGAKKKLFTVPPFQNLGTAVLRDAAVKRATKALLEAVVIRSKTGHFPESLDREVDPVSGAPFRLERQEGSLRIFGPNPEPLASFPPAIGLR